MCQSHFPPQLRCITAVESPESLVPPRFGDLPGRGGPHVAVAVTVKPNPCIVCARRILLLASLFPDLVVHSATALVVILSYSSFLLLAALCTNRDIVFGNSPRHSAGCGCRRPLHHSSPRPKGGWKGLDLAADGPAFPGQPFCRVGLRHRCASHAGEKNRRDTTSSPRRARPPARGRSCALPARRGWTISSPSCAPYAGLRPVSGASAPPGGRSLAMSPRYPDQRSVPARTPCRPTAARSRLDTSPQPTRRPRGRLALRRCCAAGRLGSDKATRGAKREANDKGETKSYALSISSLFTSKLILSVQNLAAAFCVTPRTTTHICCAERASPQSLAAPAS